MKKFWLVTLVLLLGSLAGAIGNIDKLVDRFSNEYTPNASLSQTSCALPNSIFLRKDCANTNLSRDIESNETKIVNLDLVLVKDMYQPIEPSWLSRRCRESWVDTVTQNDLNIQRINAAIDDEATYVTFFLPRSRWNCGNILALATPFESTRVFEEIVDATDPAQNAGSYQVTRYVLRGEYMVLTKRFAGYTVTFLEPVTAEVEIGN